MITIFFETHDLQSYRSEWACREYADKYIKSLTDGTWKYEWGCLGMSPMNKENVTFKLMLHTWTSSSYFQSNMTFFFFFLLTLWLFWSIALCHLGETSLWQTSFFSFSFSFYKNSSLDSTMCFAPVLCPHKFANATLKEGQRFNQSQHN